MNYLTGIKRAVDIVVNRIHNQLVERELVPQLAEVYPLPGTVECVLNFADDPVNSYQIRQWYEPMKQLAEVHPVAIMVRKPVTAKNLMADSPLPIALAKNMPQQEELISSNPVKIIFYVNNSKENFLTLRFKEPTHIHLSHGESDKVSMTSNQLKAYDFAFIAGSASRERILRELRHFDANHLIEVGRPQLDAPRSRREVPDDGRTVVLYAPTWEGDRPEMAYASIVSHGVKMVTKLLADPSIRLIYRPHPRVGVRDKSLGEASKSIRALIAEANELEPAAGHVVDETADFRPAMDVADVGIVDVSAMAVDWLATRKPVIITRPSDPLAHVDAAGLAATIGLFPEYQAGDIVESIGRLRSEGASDAQLAEVKRYFGDTSPGASMARFLSAVEQVLD